MGEESEDGWNEESEEGGHLGQLLQRMPRRVLCAGEVPEGEGVGDWRLFLPVFQDVLY